MDWEALAELQRMVADHLRDQRDDRWSRACCTHAYYAAYAAITDRLPAGAVFGRGWNNPAHAALPGHVSQMPRLTESRKDAIRTALSRLRQRREDADYRPHAMVNRTVARESLRDLATLLAVLPARRAT
jgi:hypothetical protein